MLTVSIIAKTITESLQQIEVIKKEIDIIEWRLDYLDHFQIDDVKDALGKIKKPILITFRAKNQGGKSLINEEERLDILKQLAETNPDYIDCEYTVPNNFLKKLKDISPTTKIIFSYHNFSETPDDLNSLFQEIKNTHADIYKIVTQANSTLDTLRMLQFVKTQSQKHPLLGHCMGEYGTPSRILGKIFGNVFTYAALDDHQTAAPGQLSVKTLKEIYQFANLNSQTHIYGLIGDPVSHSHGHLFHNRAYRQLDINAVYVKLLVNSPELPLFFELIRDLPFRGFSVTMPLKQAVMPFLDEMSELGKKIGAINTIKIMDGYCSGENTDGIGAINAVKKHSSLTQKNILIIGAGGAARAIAFTAKQAGAHITIFNRSQENAAALAKNIDANSYDFDETSLAQQQCYDIVINTLPTDAFLQTSSELFTPFLQHGPLAMDIVYNPKETPFLKLAATFHCEIIYGVDMFVNQALKQLEFWFGLEVSPASFSQ